MKISASRYDRDQQSIKIAVWFLANEARTQTIRAWTGLSGDRIRKLYREYMASTTCFVTRKRGNSPRQVAYFWDTARVRQETVWLASLLTLFGVVKREQSAGERQTLPDLERAELLCCAYEIYRSMIPSAKISFEHAVFLTQVLWHGKLIRLGTCPGCGSLTIVDPVYIQEGRCALCSYISK